MSEVDHTAEAQRWLRYAREDLAAAKALGERAGGAPRQSCWLGAPPLARQWVAYPLLRRYLLDRATS